MSAELTWLLNDNRQLNDIISAWLISERLKGNRCKRSFQIEYLAISFRETWMEAEYANSKDEIQKIWPRRYAYQYNHGDISDRLFLHIHIMTRILVNKEDPIYVKLSM